MCSIARYSRERGLETIEKSDMCAAFKSLANGVSASTGMPLGLDIGARYGSSLPKRLLRQDEELLARAKVKTVHHKYGAIGDVDTDDLKDAGWGILFPSSYSESLVANILQVMSRLVEHRRAESDNRWKV